MAVLWPWPWLRCDCAVTVAVPPMLPMPSFRHSQQRFHYMGHGGEINADQAHRGYYVTTHDDGLASVNPLYMS